MEGCERDEEREKFLLILKVLVLQAVVILLKKEVKISEKTALLVAKYGFQEMDHSNAEEN